MRKIRVLVVGGQDVLRYLICWQLRTAEDIEIVSQAVSGGEAIVKVCQLQPDVVLLSMYTPGINSLDVLKGVKRVAPKVKVVAFAGSVGNRSREEALDLGASAYISAEKSLSSFPTTVRQVASG